MFCIVLCALEKIAPSGNNIYFFPLTHPQTIHEASFSSWEKDTIMMMKELNCLKLIHVKNKTKKKVTAVCIWQNLF